MKFLLDTNIVISVEPTSPDDAELGTPISAELIALLSKGGHSAYVHPASVAELDGDKNAERRGLRNQLLAKYPKLPSPPRVPATLETTLGRPDPGSNDEIDHRMLAAVIVDSIDYLVTEDQKLIKKARRIGVGNCVLTPGDAVATLRRLDPTFSGPPLVVDKVVAHDLDPADPIFNSFRADYPGFDAWMKRCRLSHRDAWVIRGREMLGAVCIIKSEEDGEHGLPGRLLKLCSFKVSDHSRGHRYGELLLKAVFTHAFGNWYDHVYVEVFPKYEELVDLFESFGFEKLPALTAKGEIVLSKPLRFSSVDYREMDPLQFHVRFGPKFLKAKDVFVVPIRPHYHEMLFPEYTRQGELFGATKPYGNSILKAYLCHSPTRKLTPGSAVLFYESKGIGQIECVGVVEATLVSQNSAEIARFVGLRTVYSHTEIETMCRHREVLAILFRQASNALASPLSIQELTRHDVLKRAPVSITQAREGGLKWIREQIELSP